MAVMQVVRVHPRPKRNHFKTERAYRKPERAHSRPDTAIKWPKRVHGRSERVHSRPERCFIALLLWYKKYPYASMIYDSEKRHRALRKYSGPKRLVLFLAQCRLRQGALLQHISPPVSKALTAPLYRPGCLHCRLSIP